MLIPLLQTVVDIQELIINKLTTLIMFAISAFAIIKSVQAYAEQNSVGKKAITEIKIRADQIEKDIDIVQRQVEECADDNQELKRSVTDLKEDYKELIKTTLQYYQNRR